MAKSNFYFVRTIEKDWYFDEQLSFLDEQSIYVVLGEKSRNVDIF